MKVAMQDDDGKTTRFVLLYSFMDILVHFIFMLNSINQSSRWIWNFLEQGFIITRYCVFFY